MSKEFIPEIGMLVRHKRTGEDYLVAGMGQLKLGAKWFPGITYSRPGTGVRSLFTRSLDSFLGSFEETREVIIRDKLRELDMPMNTPRGKIEQWFRMPGNRKRIAGDIVAHEVERKVGVDAITSELRYFDAAHGIAITQASVYDLDGPEVTVGG